MKKVEVMNWNDLLERAVKLEYSKYYKYTEATLKFLNNDPNRLLSLYGVKEEDTLFEGKLNAIRGFWQEELKL